MTAAAARKSVGAALPKAMSPSGTDRLRREALRERGVFVFGHRSHASAAMFAAMGGMPGTLAFLVQADDDNGGPWTRAVLLRPRLVPRMRAAVLGAALRMLDEGGWDDPALWSQLAEHISLTRLGIPRREA